MIVDNYATHKKQEIRSWLAKNPRCMWKRMKPRTDLIIPNIDSIVALQTVAMPVARSLVTF
jgi:hypothetical protein